MSRIPLLVVAGLPELAAQAEASGRFPAVIGVGSTSELLGAFERSELARRLPQDVVFVFADTVTDNSTPALSDILRRLTGVGYHVIIVAVTARGADLARQHPKAGLLPTPVGMNELLYAVATFGYDLEPIGAAPATPTAPAPAPAPSPTRAAAQPVTETPAAPANKPKPLTGGWGTPAAGPSDPAPQPATGPAPRPAQPAPQPMAPQPAPQPMAPQPIAPRPAPQPAPQQQSEPRPVWPVSPPQQYAPAAGATSPRPSLFSPAAGGTVGGPVPRPGTYTAAPARVQRRGHAILVGAAKGGVGKSSLSLNLAAFLGMRLRSLGKTVCVVDLSFQQADIGKYLDGVSTPNISTIAENPSLLTRERILEALVHKPEYNLSVLLGPHDLDRGNPLNITPDLYLEVIALLKEHFDYIIFDSPVAEKFHDILAKVALPSANYVIAVVAPNYPTLFNVDAWLRSAVISPRHAQGAGIDPSRIGILLNRAEEGIGCSEEDVRMTMAQWNFIGIIPESKEWKLANNNNELVAPKAYVELNQAFATVLYAATGEQILVANVDAAEPRRGLGALVERVIGRKR